MYILIYLLVYITILCGSRYCNCNSIIIVIVLLLRIILRIILRIVLRILLRIVDIWVVNIM